jgi:hypothetical protein
MPDAEDFQDWVCETAIPTLRTSEECLLWQQLIHSCGSPSLGKRGITTYVAWSVSTWIRSSKGLTDSVPKWAKDLCKFQAEADCLKFGPDQALAMFGIKVDFDPKYGTVLKGTTYNRSKVIANIVSRKNVGWGITKAEWPTKLADLAAKITPFEKGDFYGEDGSTLGVHDGGGDAGNTGGGQSQPVDVGGQAVNAGGNKGGG